MALLGNYSVILKNPATFIGGTQVSNARSAFNMEGQMLQMYYGESEGGGLPFTSSLDTGTEPPYSWHLAEYGGELSSTTMINGEADLTITSLALGKALEAAMAGVGTIDTAGLSLVTSMIALIEGLGELTGSMVGTIQMAADLAGSGDITGSLNMLSGMVANLAGTGTLTSDLKGTLSMAADIYVNQSEETVQQIVDAVWNALLVEYNLAGSTGEALSGAGSAGNPWITDLSAYNTANTAGKILKDRLSKGQFIGLK